MSPLPDDLVEYVITALGVKIMDPQDSGIGQCPGDKEPCTSFMANDQMTYVPPDGIASDDTITDAAVTLQRSIAAVLAVASMEVRDELGLPESDGALELTIDGTDVVLLYVHKGDHRTFTKQALNDAVQKIAAATNMQSLTLNGDGTASFADDGDLPTWHFPHGIKAREIVDEPVASKIITDTAVTLTTLIQTVLTDVAGRMSETLGIDGGDVRFTVQNGKVALVFVRNESLVPVPGSG